MCGMCHFKEIMSIEISACLVPISDNSNHSHSLHSILPLFSHQISFSCSLLVCEGKELLRLH